MRKPTISELRERELSRLVSYKTDTPIQADFDEARRLMNSYYRLCGLSERNLYLTNNERTCNSRSTKQSEDREDKWWRRLDAEFDRIYNLRLVYCGYMPSIVKVLDHGGVSTAVSTFFYE